MTPDDQKTYSGLRVSLSCRRVDLDAVCSDAINLILLPLKARVREPAFKMKDLTDWFDETNVPQDEYVNSILRDVAGFDKDKKGAGISDILLVGMAGSAARDIEGQIVGKLRPFLAPLNGEPRVPEQWGACVRDDLASASDRTMCSLVWKQTNRMGYALQVLKFSGLKEGLGRSPFLIPSASNKAVEALAIVMMRLDIPKWTRDLMSVWKEMSMDERTDRANRDVNYLKRLLQRVWAVPATYRAAARRFFHQLTRPWRQHSLSFWAGNAGAASTIVLPSTFALDKDHLEDIPDHALTSGIASLLTSLTDVTLAGEKPCLASFGQDWEISYLPQHVPQAMQMAAAELVSRDSCFTATPMDAKAAAFELGLTTTRSLASYPEIVQEMKLVAGIIGFKSSKLGPVRIDSWNSNFLMTDGQAFDDDPTGAAFGLIPLLSKAHVEEQSFTREFDHSFLLGSDSQTTYTYPTPGVVTTQIGLAFMELTYLPEHLLMGEDGTDAFTAASFDTTDPSAAMVYSYWVGKGTVFLDRTFDPSRFKPDSAVTQLGGWDAWAENSDAAVLKAAWGQATSKMTASVMMIAQAMEGKQFRLRIPIISSITERYFVYDMTGNRDPSGRGLGPKGQGSGASSSPPPGSAPSSKKKKKNVGLPQPPAGSPPLTPTYTSGDDVTQDGRLMRSVALNLPTRTFPQGDAQVQAYLDGVRPPSSLLVKE